MTFAPSMPLFCNDFMGSTAGLSLEQSGAVLHILMATWANGCRPFADDSAVLARICKVSCKRFSERIRPHIVSFFDLSDGRWRNSRLEREWEYVAKRAAVARANGAHGGRRPTQPPTNGAAAQGGLGQNGSENRPKTEGFSGHNPDSFQDDKPLNSNETGNPAGSSWDTPGETQRASTHPQPSSAKASEEEDAGARVVETARRVAAMAGIPVDVAMRDLAIVAAWLKEGADPDVDVYPVVADVMNRTKQVRIRGFKYFSDEIGTQRSVRLSANGENSNVQHIRRGKRSGGSDSDRLMRGIFDAFSDVVVDGDAGAGGGRG